MIVTVVSTGIATILTEPAIVTVVSTDTAATDEIYDCYSCVNGYCNNVDGTCDCPPGFTGQNCDQQVCTKLITTDANDTVCEYDVCVCVCVCCFLYSVCVCVCVVVVVVLHNCDWMLTFYI